MGNDGEEQEEAGGSGQSAADYDLGAGEVLDPENGPTELASKLQKMAAEALAKHLTEVVDCVVTNVKKHHLPSAKMLLDLAGRVQSEDGVSEAEYRSFAEELWKAYQKSVGDVVG